MPRSIFTYVDAGYLSAPIYCSSNKLGEDLKQTRNHNKMVKSIIKSRNKINKHLINEQRTRFRI